MRDKKLWKSLTNKDLISLIIAFKALIDILNKQDGGFKSKQNFTGMITSAFCELEILKKDIFKKMTHQDKIALAVYLTSQSSVHLDVQDTQESSKYLH